MYIDSLTITAFVVFVIAVGMFVKVCFIMSCMVDKGNKVEIDRDVKPGDER
jgi:hypothetical protein